MTRLAMFVLAGCLLLSFWAVTPMLGAEPAGDATRPTHMYYFKQRIDLTVDADQVAVRRSSVPVGRTAIQGLSDVAASRNPSGDARWQVLTMETPGRDAANVSQRLATAIADPSVAFAAPVFRHTSGHWTVPSQDVLLQIAPEHRQDADAIVAELAPGLTIVAREFGGTPGAFQLRSSLPNGWDVLALANRLAEDDRIAWAEPDWLSEVVTSLIPNDPYFSSLWGIRNTGQSGGAVDVDMDGDLAWDLNLGDPSVRVLILDSGVQQNHPDLNQDPGADFTGQGTGGGPATAYDNHGTAVAGCVSAIANNGIGVTGVAPGCKVISAKYSSHTDNSGTGTYFISDLVNALNWGVTMGAKCSVSSFSIGSSSAVTNAYNNTRSAGILHFGATGNGYVGTVEYPASLASVVAVGGIDRYGNRHFNYGSGIGFTAPAVSIWTTDRTGSAGYSSGDYDLVDGTSFACPYAAGCAALTFSHLPWMTPDDVLAQLESTAKDRGAPGYDTSFGWGLISANNFSYDCNGNGTADEDEIAADPSLDCQPDTILDECQLTGNDCNANSVPDECDLDGNDCNNNNIPDDCELAGNDCNANNIPDDCDATAFAATIAAPQDQTVCVGDTTAFSVSAAGATGYQWYKGATPLSNGGNISGTATATLNIDPVTSGDAGVYSCEVSSGCIQAPSSTADLTLMSDNLEVTMVSNVVQSTCASAGTQLIVFEVAVDNPIGVAYQWSHEGVDLVDGGDISGATTHRLEIGTPTGADVGEYTCTASNTCSPQGASTTGFLQLAGAFVTQPPATVCAEYGEAAIFTAELAEPLPDQLYWLENGVVVEDDGRVSGINSDTLVISNVQPSDDGRVFELLAYVNSPSCFNYSNETTLQAMPVGGCPQECANPGDMDDDGDYDLLDVQLFSLCFGADVIAVPQCACANVDAGDTLVTIQDWIALEVMIGGPF